MSLFDLIAVLKKEPKPEKAAKAMYGFAAGLLFLGAWNFALPQFDPRYSQPPFNIPEFYPGLALAFSLVLGLMFFASGRGIIRQTGWGRRLAQISLGSLLAGSVLMNFLAGGAVPFGVIPLLVFSVIFAVPTYYGICHLGRLPIREDGFLAEPPRAEDMVLAENSGPKPTEKFHDGLLRLGPIGTMALSLGGLFLSFHLVESYLPGHVEIIFLAFFLVFSFLIGANYVPSSFQRSRETIDSFTGGGGTFWFHGSFPFVRLLVYADGVELRLAAQRYFIPYGKMTPPDRQASFFSSGLLIESDLPGVPSRFRFGTWGMNNITRLVRESFDRATAA